MRDLNRASHKTLCPYQQELCPGLDLILSSPSSLPQVLIYAQGQRHIHIDLGTWTRALPSEINESVTETAVSQE